jgi:hypothetical protein
MSRPFITISGADKATLAAATDALCAVIKAAGTEAAVVASVNALVALAKAPENVSITQCSFTGDVKKAARK